MNLMRNGKMPSVTIEQAQKNFCKVFLFIMIVCLLKFCFLVGIFKEEHVGDMFC